MGPLTNLYNCIYPYQILYSLAGIMLFHLLLVSIYIHLFLKVTLGSSLNVQALFFLFFVFLHGCVRLFTHSICISYLTIFLLSSKVSTTQMLILFSPESQY